MARLLAMAVLASIGISGAAQAQCTFRMTQEKMAEAMAAFQQLQQRDPQRAQQLERRVQQMMANAPEMSGRVSSDDAPVPEAMCEFWDDVLDLIED